MFTNKAGGYHPTPTHLPVELELKLEQFADISETIFLVYFNELNIFSQNYDSINFVSSGPIDKNNSSKLGFILIKLTPMIIFGTISQLFHLDLTYRGLVPFCRTVDLCMVTSSNGNIFRVTGHLCGEFTGYRWIPRTKASDAELCCFLWSASE